VLDVQFTRDKLGRIIQKLETIQGVTDTFVYTYDTAGRLTDVTKNGAVASHYTYDSNGNRLSQTDQAGTVNGTYDTQDRLTQYGNLLYTYTANGELLTKNNPTLGQAATFTYDVLGNLTKVVLPNSDTIDYVIDGKNRRIGKKVNGALVKGFLYQSLLNPVAELDGAGVIVSRFVYATRTNVPDFVIKGSVTYRIISDHLSSPRLVINTADGTVAQRVDYDEFGNIVQDTNPGFQPFGLAGGLYDPQTGLTRFGARDYDAQSGRWTAKDEVRFNTDETNLFEYTKNDPVNYLDNTGLAKNSLYCAALERKIQNLIENIKRREGELRENPLGLPGKCPGGKPSESRQGHQGLIDRDKAKLAERQAEYLAFCSDDPPNGTPANDESFFDKKYWEKVTGLTGAALATYLIISEGSRLFPPRNLVPVP